MAWLAWHPAKNKLGVITKDGKLPALAAWHPALVLSSGAEQQGAQQTCIPAALPVERPSQLHFCRPGVPAKQPACLKHHACSLCRPAGQLAVWQEPVPAKLPGPTADVDALAGIKQVCSVFFGFFPLFSSLIATVGASMNAAGWFWCNWEQLGAAEMPAQVAPCTAPCLPYRRAPRRPARETACRCWRAALMLPLAWQPLRMSMTRRTLSWPIRVSCS